MAWDKSWEEIYLNNEWGKYPSEELIRFVASNYYRYSNREDISILEIGCGPGSNIWYISREGFSVYGIDGSETAIKKAQFRLDNEVENWKGELVVGDFLYLPYEDCTFDGVIDNEAIYVNSFGDSKKILKEVHRVLKPNGKFYSRTFATSSWGDNTGDQLGYNYWIPNEGPLAGKGTSRFTSENDIKILFEDFKINEVELLQRTYNNQKKYLKEWIISAEKELE